MCKPACECFCDSTSLLYDCTWGDSILQKANTVRGVHGQFSEAASTVPTARPPLEAKANGWCEPWNPCANGWTATIAGNATATMSKQCISLSGSQYWFSLFSGTRTTVYDNDTHAQYHKNYCSEQTEDRPLSSIISISSRWASKRWSTEDVLKWTECPDKKLCQHASYACSSQWRLTVFIHITV